MLLLAVPFGLVIGLVVGAVGGGGAILALPVLVYVLGEPVGPASTTSLIVVALGAAVGAARPALNGHVCWRVAGSFSAAAIPGTMLGAVANHQIGARALVLAFVPLMLVIAAVTWRRASAARETEIGGCPAVSGRRVAMGGLAVGALTGFFGVGGGFVIVPVLTVGLGLRFRRGVATSLAIIAVTSLAGLASHLAQGARPEVAVTAVLAGATAAGALTGTFVGRRLPQERLGKAFALMVAVVAVLLFLDTVTGHGPPGA